MKYCFVFLFLFSFTAYSQIKRDDHWFFGYEAGMDFSSGTAVADTNGKLVSIEGSSSISDPAGKLLFYTNGEAVWNRDHKLMPNGSGLLGNQSSSQSSVIIPDPGNPDLYYIFITEGYTYSTSYSVVDMRLDGGLGDVGTTKNVTLYSEGTEELAATMHCNAADYWVVCRQKDLNSLKFHAFRVDAGGVGKAVTTTFSTKNSMSNKTGCLTFSQDGKTLCFSSFDTRIFLFDFNTANGKLSLRDSIVPYTNESVYSNALSPDGKKLYITSWVYRGNSYLSQFDLTHSPIASSRVDLDSVDYSKGSPNGYGFLGHIRLASDQKIYMSRWHQATPFKVHPGTYYSLDSIDVISKPDLTAFACNVTRNALYLDHKPTQIGLSNFVSNYTALTTPENTCLTQDIPDAADITVVAAFPNPFADEITLQINTQLTDASLLILNSSGQKVRQTDHIAGNKMMIRRGNLPCGAYTIRIIQEGQHILSYRILVSPF